MAVVEWKGYDALQGKLQRAAHLSFADVIPLLEQGEQLLIEANRQKVLSGLDGKGNPEPEVTYRGGFAIGNGKRFANFGKTKFAAKGVGFKGIKAGNPHANGNLTTAEYRKLTGPPLAPRGEKSRVITNIETSIGEANGVFYAAKAWRDVVDKDGRPFLMAHFKGARTGKGLKVKLKKRDLRGISQKERADFAQLAALFLRDLIAGRIK